MVALGKGLLAIPLTGVFPRQWFSKVDSSLEDCRESIHGKAWYCSLDFCVLALVCEGSGKGEKWKPHLAEEVWEPLQLTEEAGRLLL